VVAKGVASDATMRMRDMWESLSVRTERPFYQRGNGKRITANG